MALEIDTVLAEFEQYRDKLSVDERRWVEHLRLGQERKWAITPEFAG